jgi:ferrous iron transport protein B
MRSVILAGRPNSGKSSLFNRLAPLSQQKVANYAGCTVERASAHVVFGQGETVELVDLPGIFSQTANSEDEKVALEELERVRGKSLVLAVLDGNHLEQELVLPLRWKAQGHQIVFVVNMVDESEARKKVLHLPRLADLVGVAVFPVSARTGEGIDSLKAYLGKAVKSEFAASSDKITLMDPGQARAQAKDLLRRSSISDGKVSPVNSLAIDRWLVHPFLGPLVFFLVMFILFQSVFSFAAPFSDGIEWALKWCGDWVLALGGRAEWASFLANGVIAGIGSVLVFVPQIAFLFLLLALLDHSGYLPRAAYMVDRLLKPYGLEGRVFIPLLSSVACAVPGIMATRNISDTRVRLVTIFISPLMTCSARLPVYTLLIGTFIPAVHWGPFSAQGLVMFSLFALGVMAALAAALFLRWVNFGAAPSKVSFLQLPRYRIPHWPEVMRYVWRSVRLFLKKAGTIIAGMAVLLWVLLHYPVSDQWKEKEAKLLSSVEWTEKRSETTKAERDLQSERLENSIGGTIGHGLEPFFRPLGYDWQLSVGILASLAAREVFVSTLGTVFALENPEENLREAILSAKDGQGDSRYSVATGLSLMVFFAFSLQCISTLGVARRETASWRIPAMMFLSLFVIAYLAAFLVFQSARFMGFG